MSCNEIWRDVKNYKGYYQVSNLGNVKSLDRFIKGGGSQNKRKIKGRVLNKSTKRNGYDQVRLSKEGVVKDFLVHRLVSDAFIEKVENKYHVNHINGIKTDNRVSNLEWCDAFDNMKHAEENNLVNNKGVNSPLSVYTEDQIKHVKKLLKNNVRTKDIVKLTGVGRTTVYRVSKVLQWVEL